MCQMLQEVYCVLMDPQSIIDRVKMLTEEIAKIREANKEYARQGYRLALRTNGEREVPGG